MIDNRELQVNQPHESLPSTVHDQTIVNEKVDVEEKVPDQPSQIEYPDGGLKAWSVVFGVISFCFYPSISFLTISSPLGILHIFLLVRGLRSIDHCLKLTPFFSFGFVNSYGVFQAYYQQTLLPNTSPSSMYVTLISVIHLVLFDI